MIYLPLIILNLIINFLIFSIKHFLLLVCVIIYQKVFKLLSKGHNLHLKLVKGYKESIFITFY